VLVESESSNVNVPSALKAIRTDDESVSDAPSIAAIT
jgi:hypothetical protein